MAALTGSGSRITPSNNLPAERKRRNATVKQIDPTLHEIAHSTMVQGTLHEVERRAADAIHHRSVHAQSSSGPQESKGPCSSPATASSAEKSAVWEQSGIKVAKHLPVSDTLTPPGTPPANPREHTLVEDMTAIGVGTSIVAQKRPTDFVFDLDGHAVECKTADELVRDAAQAVVERSDIVKGHDDRLANLDGVKVRRRHSAIMTSTKPTKDAEADALRKVQREEELRNSGLMFRDVRQIRVSQSPAEWLASGKRDTKLFMLTVYALGRGIVIHAYEPTSSTAACVEVSEVELEALLNRAADWYRPGDVREHPLIVEYWQEAVEPLMTRLRWRPFPAEKKKGANGKPHRTGELVLDRNIYKMGITLLNGIGVSVPLLATIDSINKQQSKKLYGRPFDGVVVRCYDPFHCASAVLALDEATLSQVLPMAPRALLRAKMCENMCKQILRCLGISDQGQLELRVHNTGDGHGVGHHTSLQDMKEHEEEKAGFQGRLGGLMDRIKRKTGSGGKAARKAHRRRSLLVHGRFQLPEATVLRVVARSGPVQVWMPHGKSKEEIDMEKQIAAAIRMQTVYRGKKTKERYQPQIKHRMRMMRKQSLRGRAATVGSAGAPKEKKVGPSTPTLRPDALPNMKRMRGNAVKWGVRVGGTTVLLVCKVTTVERAKKGNASGRAKLKLTKLKNKLRTVASDAFGSIDNRFNLDEAGAPSAGAKCVVLTAYDPVSSRSCAMTLMPHELKAALATKGADWNPEGSMAMTDIAELLARRIDLFLSREKRIMKLQLRSRSPTQHGWTR